MAAEKAATKTTKFNDKGDWPGYGDLLERTVSALKLNKEFLYVYVGVITALSLLTYIADGTSRGVYSGASFTGLGLLEVAAQLILMPASVFYALHTSRGNQAPWQEFINKGLGKLLPLIGLAILAGLAIVVGLVLFIIPGIYLILKLAVSSFALVDKNLGVVESMKASFAITKGNVGKVAGYIGVSILISIIAGILTWIPVVGTAVSALVSLGLLVLGAYVYRWIDAHPETAKTPAKS